jgi:protocatechuate 4,5-dioxygenase alpha chain
MARNWRQDMPSVFAYRMDKVLYEVHHIASHLERYRADADEYMKDVALPAALKAAIRDNDIGAMYLAGVNPYLLRAHCLGLGIPEPVFVQSLRKVAAGTAPAGGDHG